MTSRSYSSMVAGREEVIAPKRRGRPPAIPRAERLASGLPVCAGSDTCDLLPWRRGLCRPHREVADLPPAQRVPPLGADVVTASFRCAADVWSAAKTAASRDGVTASEWVRRVVVRALGQPRE